MNINALIDNLSKSAPEQIFIDKVKVNNREIFEIVTPFLDRRNDNITLYAYEKRGKIRLTDMGYTLNDLAISGINILNSKKTRKTLHSILASFEINLNSQNNELFTETTPENFAQRKHDLIQAIIKINQLQTVLQNEPA